MTKEKYSVVLNKAKGTKCKHFGKTLRDFSCWNVLI